MSTTLVSMLGIDRRALKVGWTLFLFALVLGALYEIRHTLVIFALALFLAHLLSPVVELLVRLRHGVSRAANTVCRTDRQAGANRPRCC